MSRIPRPYWLNFGERVFLICLTMAIGLATPWLALVYVKIRNGLSVEDAIVHVAQLPGAQRQEVVLVALMGLTPFAVLALLLALYSARGPRRGCWVMQLCGLAGILVLMLPTLVISWSGRSATGGLPPANVMVIFVLSTWSIMTLILGLKFGERLTGSRWVFYFPKGHCPRCGYNLRGNVSGVCPECGGTEAS